VKSIAALKAGLGKTLMERIVENKPEVVTLLRMQYRMNEEIMRFSSDWFYGNRVESAPEVKYRSILDLDVPMEWIDTSALMEGEGLEAENELFREEFVGENFGRINKAEAELTLLTLQQYFERIGKTRVLNERLDVGVISPYRAQVQYLRSQLRKKEYFKPFRTLISVNTVDGFQGQERDIIVISLVRSNDEGQIGFLRDLRRMNVAITRARMKLIILGDAHTMARHPFYRRLYEYIEALKLTAGSKSMCE
jgi:superfamily I DNA and/or RNA helicase